MLRAVIQSAFFVLALLGCGSSPRLSQLEGHYEHSGRQEVEGDKGQQRVPAEYEHNQSVIVSYSLLTSFEHEDLVKALVDAGVSKVWIMVPGHSQLSLKSGIFNKLRRLLSSDIGKIGLVAHSEPGSLTVWARDWSPLGALTQDGDLRFLDLNYYPSRPADDAASRVLSEALGVRRISLPVYNEGGNFMTNQQGYCLMTERVTDANGTVFKKDDLLLDAEAIATYYRDFAGCTQVRIMPRMPSEKTGHIDMWAKFLDDKTVIVNELRAATLDAARSLDDRAFAETVGRFLNDRAQDIAALGFKVLRIPMPLPRRWHFRSYSNALLVNGTAIVPQYRGRDADASLVEGYEAEVKAVYQQAGFQVRFIPSDDLISAGGAVHCVTMQVAGPGSN